jgi:hypothetical protein
MYTQKHTQRLEINVLPRIICQFFVKLRVFLAILSEMFLLTLAKSSEINKKNHPLNYASLSIHVFPSSDCKERNTDEDGREW